jgi:hypothetical protein
MPYDDPDASDPTMLVGVEIPANESSDIEMAYAFAEEFAQLGYSVENLMALFRNPHYAGAHRALRVLGEEKIASIIREAADVWNRFRVVFRDVDNCRGAL